MTVLYRKSVKPVTKYYSRQHKLGHGVRKLHLQDQLPDCKILINQKPYELKNLVTGRIVLDIGCGFGRNKMIVEEAAFLIRGIFWIKSNAAYAFLRLARKKTAEEAKTLSLRYFQLECLRQSNGFTFVIQKL